MDMYLDWHHAGIRLGASGFLVKKYFSGMLNGEWSTQEAINES